MSRFIRTNFHQRHIPVTWRLHLLCTENEGVNDGEQNDGVRPITDKGGT